VWDDTHKTKPWEGFLRTSPEFTKQTPGKWPGEDSSFDTEKHCEESNCAWWGSSLLCLLMLVRKHACSDSDRRGKSTAASPLTRFAGGSQFSNICLARDQWPRRQQATASQAAFKGLAGMGSDDRAVWSKAPRIANQTKTIAQSSSCVARVERAKKKNRKQRQ
jgi:hypothetical protein